MLRHIIRFLLVALLSVLPLSAGEATCASTARECDLQIRQLLRGRRFFGATIAEMHPGLTVKAVAEQSPSERAGLRVGDRLIAINGKSLTRATIRDYKQHLSETGTNGKLWLMIWRRGTYRRIDARLEPYTKQQVEKIIATHLAHSHPATAGVP